MDLKWGQTKVKSLYANKTKQLNLRMSKASSQASSQASSIASSSTTSRSPSPPAQSLRERLLAKNLEIDFVPAPLVDRLRDTRGFFRGPPSDDSSDDVPDSLELSSHPEPSVRSADEEEPKPRYLCYYGCNETFGSKEAAEAHTALKHKKRTFAEFRKEKVRGLSAARKRYKETMKLGIKTKLDVE